MASGRSQLGADIHEIDKAASRCGRLLDEVAGDADAVAERRDEIIAAMAGTAKPYFGDVGEMTYARWLHRYVELAIGAGDSTADTRKGHSPWLDVTWRDRWAEMLTPVIEPSVRLLHALKAKGVPAFALSNFGDETFERTRQGLPFLNTFDRSYISGRLGVSKPDPRIYEIVEADCGLPPGDLLFTDDRADNIAAAAARAVADRS